MRYPPVGRCIYCGSTEAPLTKEHIIPFGLGGDRILPEASCEDCREKTRKVEEFCLRNILGKTRITMGIRTRHPKERPSHFPFTLELPDGTKRQISVPVSEFPIMLALPVFEPADAMRQYPIVTPGPQFQGVWRFAPPDTEAFVVRHGGTSVIIGEFEPLRFARMLAKIAHGFAVGELGLDGFTPNTLGLIRGETDNYAQFVGGGIGDSFDNAGLHNINRYTHNDTGDIAITIRLFASLSAPIYHVLVGRLVR